MSENECQKCKELRVNIVESEKRVMSLCMDWAEDHTYAQNVAMSLGFSQVEVDGDSYGIKTIQCLIDMIASKAVAVK